MNQKKKNEEFLDYEPIEVEDSDLLPSTREVAIAPSSLSEVNDIINSSEQLVKALSLTVSTVCSTIEDIKRISAEVEIEISRMDHMIDGLMVKANRDIEIYKVSIPTLNEQFNRFQQRLDKLMERALDMVSTDLSDNALARSEFAMRLIEQTNDGLNRLIEKLIPKY